MLDPGRVDPAGEQAFWCHSNGKGILAFLRKFVAKYMGLHNSNWVSHYIQLLET